MENTISTKLDWKNGACCSANFGAVDTISVTSKTALADNPKAWSPVHMLLSAAETCFFVTFQMIADKSHVSFSHFSSEATAEIGMPDGKHHAITSITIKPKVTLINEADRQKLDVLFQKAEEYCTVANSLNFKVVIAV